MRVVRSSFTFKILGRLIIYFEFHVFTIGFIVIFNSDLGSE